MAATSCCLLASNGSLSLSSFRLANAQASVPLSFLPINYRSKPKFGSANIKVNTARLRISQKVRTPSENLFRPLIVSCLLEDEAGVFPESRDPSVPTDSLKDALIDIKLQRRSLLVKFTCNACGVRSQKFVNRLAYERGTVFVQCSGCFQNHKLVDNLGLVVEYNFQDETNVDQDINQP